MKKSYGHIDGLSWHAMDASAMSLADGSFDAIIEKGLFDALFAGTGMAHHLTPANMIAPCVLWRGCFVRTHES